MNYTLTVRKAPVGRTYGIYVQPDGGAEELLEGGFFSKAAAERSKDEWAKDLLRESVERAERKAGWDSRP